MVEQYRLLIRQKGGINWLPTMWLIFGKEAAEQKARDLEELTSQRYEYMAVLTGLGPKNE